MLKIHVVSETPFVMKGQGVHTAFVEQVALLKEKNDVQVVVNEEGWGDVMHCHTYGPYYFWKGRKYKGRRIHTAHVIPDSIKGSLPMWKYLFPFVNWFFKKVFSYADVVIALSPMVEEAILALGVKSRIVKIYNPVLISKWKRTNENRQKGRELLKLSGDKKVILGVGQLQSRKGLEDFLDIAEAIPEATFVWVGGRPFGKLTEGIERINNRIKKASQHIYFAGMFDLAAMPAIYAAADVLLFPSYQENCPLAPLEAAACGMPVVYRDIREYSLLYKFPYLKAATTEAYIALTKKLLHEPEFYRQGLQISEQLIKQFDQEKIRQELIDLYREVVGKD
ncbi:glycosyltransferase family 4 protein [Mucilaginibacter arboris]|uniref:Glycosyltransferase n=1 Tax=Mucilaginibacter arboris TaxID=2682090 RepID=A0A7K1SVU4_9SPHI|nr:glycosyltransferase [Mucilaginibacter arboris]MVN21413.1 glycosyltransferase [Mucilaginibacter arboris]